MRSDVLVSVGLVADLNHPEILSKLRRLSETLSSSFGFWEILVAAPASSDRVESSNAKFLAEIPNIRVIFINDSVGFYRFRLAVASEAIGDVVVLTSLDEMDAIDVEYLAIQSYENDQVVVMSRKDRSVFLAMVLPIVRFLTGFKINQQDSLTSAYPRAWLATILARTDAELALRFEPKSRAYPIKREQIPNPQLIPKRKAKDVERRLLLLTDLISNSANRILRGLTLVSLSVTLISFAYIIYATIIWLFKANVTEGWFSTSLLLALIFGFLGLAISAISLGIVKLFDQLEGVMNYAIVDEITNVDFFSDVDELNVVVEGKTQDLESNEINGANL